MKRIEDQTYYEILEINPSATPKEIQRAYDRARETFHADSLAVYSLFSEKEVRTIQSRIEEAYRVLIDEGLREGYDQSHPAPEPALDQDPLVYRGKTLKRIREKFGMDLKAISSQTKITLRVLEWIEEEALDKLPPEVYLKGFLRAYAQCLGLEPQKVVDGYLQFRRENRAK